MKLLGLDYLRSSGLLQEVNRLFFHRLGLALVIAIDDKTGEAVSIAGIIDNREVRNMNGMFFTDVSQDMIENVENMLMVFKEGRARLRITDDEGVQFTGAEEDDL